MRVQALFDATYLLSLLCAYHMHVTRVYWLFKLWVIFNARLELNAINANQRGVTPQSSVLPTTTTVKHKVKGQEARIIKVKDQA